MCKHRKTTKCRKDNCQMFGKDRFCIHFSQMHEITSRYFVSNNNLDVFIKLSCNNITPSDFSYLMLPFSHLSIDWMAVIHPYTDVMKFFKAFFFLQKSHVHLFRQFRIEHSDQCTIYYLIICTQTSSTCRVSINSFKKRHIHVII